MIAKGNIVTIMDDDNLFGGKQALVESVNGEQAFVRLYRESTYLLGALAEDEEVWEYSTRDLRRDEEWSIETLADRLFGRRMWNIAYSIEYKFVPGKEDCTHSKCYRKTKKRIVYNVWGAVCHADVCAAHAEEFHGKAIDYFPCKKRRIVSV